MAIGLFFIVIMTSLAQHQVGYFDVLNLIRTNLFSQFFWRSMTTGALARAALISSIYKRGVRLSGEARTQYTNAALINHISTDVGFLFVIRLNQSLNRVTRYQQVSRIDAASQWFVSPCS